MSRVCNANWLLRFSLAIIDNLQTYHYASVVLAFEQNTRAYIFYRSFFMETNYRVSKHALHTWLCRLLIFVGKFRVTVEILIRSFDQFFVIEFIKFQPFDEITLAVLHVYELPA